MRRVQNVFGPDWRGKDNYSLRILTKLKFLFYMKRDWKDPNPVKRLPNGAKMAPKKFN